MGNPMAIAMRSITNPNNPEYDPELDKNMREYFPEFFAIPITEAQMVEGDLYTNACEFIESVMVSGKLNILIDAIKDKLLQTDYKMLVIKIDSYDNPGRKAFRAIEYLEQFDEKDIYPSF